jgi:hypothetical protein
MRIPFSMPKQYSSVDVLLVGLAISLGRAVRGWCARNFDGMEERARPDRSFANSSTECCACVFSRHLQLLMLA